MKISILKLDDIGRESHGPTHDLVSWAMQRKIPVSIGTIGRSILTMPTELRELLKLAIKLGFVEIWNHGYAHIRYDNATPDELLDDLVKGHEAVKQMLGVLPGGLGFPFNKFSEDAVSIVRETYPDYFLYEVDFPSYRMITPEYNVFGDGQPQLSATKERVGNVGGDVKGLIVQAHPPRWSKNGTKNFFECASYIAEEAGFVFLTAADALIFDNNSNVRLPVGSPLECIVGGRHALSRTWSEQAVDYKKSLSNFDTYFLRRFDADCEKNYIQTRRELYPFKAGKILDVGCGLGNWSLPFALAGECSNLVLNDINETIVKALNDGVKALEQMAGVTIDGRNLLDYGRNSTDNVDLLICTNTFNYLDPVLFFKFARHVVVPDGRMLLLVQTEAFNTLRYKSALSSRNRATAAEVLSSYFAMLLRRELGLIPSGVRHLFSQNEITLLAKIFDFDLANEFVPVGEGSGEYGATYQCLIFKRNRGAKNIIASSPEWTERYRKMTERLFGVRALRETGFAEAPDSEEFSFYSDWTVAAAITTEHSGSLCAAKKAIEYLGSGEGNEAEFKARINAIDSTALAPIVDRLLECAALF